MIVVGNPDVLARDPNWSLLRLAVRNGAYTGSAELARGFDSGRGGAAYEDVASLLQWLVISGQEAAAEAEAAVFSCIYTVGSRTHEGAAASHATHAARRTPSAEDADGGSTCLTPCTC